MHPQSTPHTVRNVMSGIPGCFLDQESAPLGFELAKAIIKIMQMSEYQSILMANRDHRQSAGDHQNQQNDRKFVD